MSESGDSVERRQPEPPAALQLRARPSASRATQERTGFISGFAGAMLEAWDELRVHRTRVLLSLIGVGVAVCALAGVVGVSDLAQQAQVEQLERGTGRPATLTLQAPTHPETGKAADRAVLEAAFEAAVDRYSVDYASAVVWDSGTVRIGASRTQADVKAVDAHYGPMHRVQLAQGRWLAERDGRRLAPAIVVSDALYQRIGTPDLSTFPTVVLQGSQDIPALVIGVTPAEEFGVSEYYILRDAYVQLVGPKRAADLATFYEFWVPPRAVG